MAAGDQQQRLQDWETPPTDVPAAWFCQRGYALEKIIRNRLDTEGLKSRINFRPSGEEIDGSFLLGDRTFLIEAKWKKDPIPASDLYSFKGKVDGKLTGTIGVFLSMSGFSADAINALKAGKEINLILFTGDDFRLIETGQISFVEALREKMRYAAEYGQPYMPLSSDQGLSTSISQTKTPLSDMMSFATNEPNTWDFVVESKADGIGLRIILGRLDQSLGKKIRIWTAGGQLNVPSLVRNLQSSGHKKIVALLETEDANQKIVHLLKENPHSTSIVLLEPNLEKWLAHHSSKKIVTEGPPEETKANLIRRLAAVVNLKELLHSNKEFTTLLEEIGFPVEQGQIAGE